jgi:NAD(P)-dependent dehydrogenase (short-subunit alcohol dehydrogenase family)
MAETQRVAIVTGAAGGIGRAMTRALLAAGIRVAGVDRDREPLEALAASVREQGKAAELLTIATDLTDDSAADAITKATRGKFGHIDILVNNAGIGPGAIRPDSWQYPLKFWEITPDQWRRFVAVHATAPLALTNAVVPEMMRQGWGRIVNVTTSLGTMLNAGSPTYGPSKAALEALSAIMAKDLDGTGVTVNVLVPACSSPVAAPGEPDHARVPRRRTGSHGRARRGLSVRAEPQPPGHASAPRSPHARGVDSESQPSTFSISALSARDRVSNAWSVPITGSKQCLTNLSPMR